jgi:hypothetical protein
MGNIRSNLSGSNNIVLFVNLNTFSKYFFKQFIFIKGMKNSQDLYE